jgi:hypothetical protein
MLNIMFGVAGGILLAGAIGGIISLWFASSIMEAQTDMMQKNLKQIQKIAIPTLPTPFLPPQQNIQLQSPKVQLFQPLVEAEEIKKNSDIAVMQARNETQSFDDQYKKPAECLNLKDSATRIKCANAYMRARSTFEKIKAHN